MKNNSNMNYKGFKNMKKILAHIYKIKSRNRPKENMKILMKHNKGRGEGGGGGVNTNTQSVTRVIGFCLFSFFL